MGLLRRLLRPSSSAFPAPPRTDVHVLDGREDLEVVGESYYQDNLWRLVPAAPGGENVRWPVEAVLVAEPDNEFDPNAVSVWIDGLKVGHLSREDAARYQRGLIALERRYGSRIAVPSVIVGGGMRDDGVGRLGVFLSHDPADFGVEPAHEPPERDMRTGLYDAFRTDAEDDSYDLGWLQELPEDPVRAIGAVRARLTTEREAISRHFLFCALEAALYRSRDAFASALDEYDETVREHDAEMDGIRAAFVAKWSKVPLLETYKQMCIRQAKAKNWEKALWWAERGIAVYGDAAHREENLLDLQKRAESYRLKLNPLPAAPKPRALRAPKHPEMQTLTCSNCGREWQRAAVRGRPPKLCPDCAVLVG